MFKRYRSVSRVQLGFVIANRLLAVFYILVFGLIPAGVALALRQPLIAAILAALTIVGCLVAFFQPVFWNPRRRVIGSQRNSQQR